MCPRLLEHPVHTSNDRKLTLVETNKNVKTLDVRAKFLANLKMIFDDVIATSLALKGIVHRLTLFLRRGSLRHAICFKSYARVKKLRNAILY